MKESITYGWKLDHNKLEVGCGMMTCAVQSESGLVRCHPRLGKEEVRIEGLQRVGQFLLMPCCKLAVAVK
jgi:hypothetical protein